MKFGKHLLITIISSMVFYSCSNDDDPILVDYGPNAVKFTSSLNGQVVESNGFTRASGTNWGSGDAIGIYMKKTGQDLSVPNLVNAVNNTKYTTTGSGNFTADNVNELIEYPEDGSKVDFIAYYPQNHSISGFVYKVDVSDQRSQEDIDLLYSNNSIAAGKGNNVNLAFSHQLVKIEFTVTPENLVEDLSRLQVSISGMKTRADFDLGTGALTVDNSSTAIFEAKVTITGAKAIVEVIVLPQAAEAGRVVQFVDAQGQIYKYNIPATLAFAKSTKNKFNVTLKTGGAVVVPDNGWFELPNGGDMSNVTIVKHMHPEKQGVRNYTMFYNTDHRLAYWVAYPLYPDMIGSSGRTDAWAYDPSLPKAQQYNLSGGFKNAISQTYDRGHQLPSADRTASKPLNRTTFYYSNMMAQEKDLNQGRWKHLEDKVRTWMGRCDTLYMVTGAMLTTETETSVWYDCYDNSGVKVATPRYIFKAIAQKRADKYYTIAYRFENKAFPKDTNFNAHRLTVKDLEAETKFTFFPSLGDDVKGKIDNSIWN